MVERRLTGEPLAWITSTAPFCEQWIVVHPGVYVPRWQTELLAGRAVERLPAGGVAIDVCTGSGALAKVLMTRGRRASGGVRHRRARGRQRRANGVEAYAATCSRRCPPSTADS